MAVAFRLFSEQESARYAGVSLDTIRQYERFGLLQSIRKDGEIFYRESDLKSVFSVSEVNAEQPDAHALFRDSVQSNGNSHSHTTLGDAARSDAQHSSHVENGFRSQVQHTSPSNGRAVDSRDQPFASQENRSTDEFAHSGAEHRANGSHPSFETERSQQSRPISPEIQAISYTAPNATGVYELLEVNKTLREQIQMLKDERDWLRRRVERSETRSERDQMLVIAENETVKTLMHQLPAKPRSFWSFALPWLKTDSK